MRLEKRSQSLVDNIEKVIIGKTDIIIHVLTAMLAGGHVLIEDVPGVGKTQLVAALARSISGDFNRLQMTPDIMPSDVVGYTMIHPETKKLIYRKGAAVCNILLVDEINRASPKAQSSLLEVMEEQQISIEGQVMPLPTPFMVLATQNPIETYGTYHLPEAQMDRFIMRLSVGYPNRQEELKILVNQSGENPLKKLQAVLHRDDIIAMQNQVQQISVHSLVQEYILSLVHNTRNNENIRLGVSPRGALALQRAAKARAFIMGRSHVLPDDIRLIAPQVLGHRIMLTPKGKSGYGTAENIIKQVLTSVVVPHPQTN